MTDNMQSNIKIQNKKVVFGYADYCVVISLFCIFLILLGEPVKSNLVVSIGSRGLILSVFGFAFFCLIKTLKEQGLKNSFYVFILYFIVLLSALVCGFSVVLGKAVQLICFLMLPTIILLFKNVQDVKRIKNAIYIANVVYTVLWTVLYFTPLSHVYYNEWGKKTIDELTLGYANANQTGMYLVVSSVISLSAFARKNRVEIKGLFLIQSLWTAYLIVQTKSRICLLLIVLVYLVSVVGLSSKVGKKITAFVIVIPLIVGLVFALGSAKILNFILLGDTVDNGRSRIVGSLIKSTNLLTFILGNFSNYVGSNLHNSYVTIFAITGIVGLFAYLIFFWKSINMYLVQIDRKSPSDSIAYLGVLAVVLHGIVEAAFITSGMIYAGLFGLLLVLTLNEGENK